MALHESGLAMKKQRKMTRDQRKKQLTRRIAAFLAVVFLLVLLPVCHSLIRRASQDNRSSDRQSPSVQEQITAVSGESAGPSQGESEILNTPAPTGADASQTSGQTTVLPEKETDQTAAADTETLSISENASTPENAGTPEDRGAADESKDTGTTGISADTGTTGTSADTGVTAASAGSNSSSQEETGSGQPSDGSLKNTSADSAGSGVSAEEDDTIRGSLEEKTEAAISRAEEIEEERNQPTEEELRQQERDRLSAMGLEELTAYLWEHEVPADLIYFMEEYPETREFVTDYLYQPETPPSKSIAGEVKKGTIPHFLQWDERWGYETYGSTYLAISGCGPTALAAIYSGLTGKTDMNPYAMAQWSEENGFYVYGSGTAWDIMTTGAAMLGLNGWMLDGGKESLLWALRSGYPVVCAMNPGDFTFFGHFIILTDVDENENIRVLDSNSRIRTQKLWNADDLMWQIAGMWAFSYDG